MKGKSKQGFLRGTTKEVRAMIKWAKKHGWHWTLTGKSHIKLTHPKGGLVFTGGTPRTPRGPMAAKQELKRQMEQHT